MEDYNDNYDYDCDYNYDDRENEGGYIQNQDLEYDEIPLQPTKLAPQASIFIYDENQILERQNQLVGQLIDQILDKSAIMITQEQAIKVLSKKDWDVDKSADFIIENLNIFTQMEIEQQNFDICLICFSNLKENNKVGLKCRHYFCLSCYKQYLKQCITDGPSGVYQTCPFTNCKYILTEEFFQKYLDHEDLIKYHKYKADAFVKEAQNVKWCPGPNCQYAFYFPKKKKSEKYKQRNLQCKCGYNFCASCNQEGHLPVQCAYYEAWMKNFEGKDDYLNQVWLEINTKQCPKCKTYIQKNQGCMHMTCNQCRHEFCWLCLADWTTHGEKTGGFYKCNMYKEDTQKSQSLSQKQKQLKKFDFYSKRYMEHKKSIDMAIQKFNNLKKDYNEMLKKVGNDKYEAFIEEMLIFLVNCRRGVAFTYVQAFYLNDPSKKELFEFKQYEIENNLERLDNLTNVTFDNNEKFLQKKPDSNDQILTQAFYNWQDEVKILYHIVQNYYNKNMEDLACGLPQVQNSLKLQKQLSEQVDFNSQYDDKWICSACTYANDNTKQKCEICDNRRV